MLSVPRILLLLAVGSFVLPGCGPESGTSSGIAQPPVPDAAALAREGLHEEAAAAWLAEAANAPETEAAALRLRAAQSWWNAGRANRAGETAGAIDPQSLDADDAARRALVLARVALADGNARGALAALPSPEALFVLPESTAALDLAVRAAGRAGQAIDELRFRIALDPRLAAPEENRDAIWSLLRALPGESLSTRPAQRSSRANGWFELEQLARVHRVDFPAFSTAVRLWRKRHPDHPADVAIVPQLLAQVRRDGLPPGHVAVLLPLSGTFASAAAAVRDGFLAGWYTESGDRPVVSVYDTGSQDPEALFRMAIAQGADFVVGPLAKKAIRRVASLPDRAVPVLLLNALEGDVVPPEGGPPVYRFALSPEDEARAVADLARRGDHRRAGIIVPETEWGRRVADAFTRRWEALGGVVAAHAEYRGVAEDLAQPVRALLDIEASAERARSMRRVLRRAVSHEPFPRGDLDFIFLAGFPREARLLRPQITFLRAPDLPVYATSHVFSGVPDPQQDLDLDGIVFNDMPWVLNPPTDPDGLRERFLDLWPAASEGFIRYYAFGIDAYRLQRRIVRLAARPEEPAISGRTGRLRVGTNGRIRIEMAWARFRNGVPELISP